jgi:hypothetical protein
MGAVSKVVFASISSAARTSFVHLWFGFKFLTVLPQVHFGADADKLGIHDAVTHDITLGVAGGNGNHPLVLSWQFVTAFPHG